jgi:RimJ/RimL family protein N-acetyltransferase
VALEVRPATEADLDLAVRAGALAAPGHPAALADEVRLFWEFSDALGPAGRWVLGPDGFLSVSREGDETHAWVELDLPSGSAESWAEAYAFAEQAARDLGAEEAVAEPWVDQVTAVEALRLRGWTQRRLERFWRLDLQPELPRLRRERDEAAARADASGVRIVSAAELGGEAVYPQLWELHNETHHDVPRSVVYVPEPYHVWKSWMVSPRVVPERVWVAVAADAPAGYSYLAFRSNGLVETGYTGMRRDFRGRGLARALKLATLVQAAELGVEAAETDNDSENAPIIHLNQALGYREIVGRFEFAKSLVG